MEEEIRRIYEEMQSAQMQEAVTVRGSGGLGQPAYIRIGQPQQPQRGERRNCDRCGAYTLHPGYHLCVRCHGIEQLGQISQPMDNRGRGGVTSNPFDPFHVEATTYDEKVPEVQLVKGPVGSDWVKKPICK